jgi:hypothetical protein
VIPTANKNFDFKVSPYGQALVRHVGFYVSCVSALRASWLAFPYSMALHPHHPLGANVDSGKGTKESKNIQDPQNHGDDDDAVQD